MVSFVFVREEARDSDIRAIVFSESVVEKLSVVASDTILTYKVHNKCVHNILSRREPRSGASLYNKYHKE